MPFPAKFATTCAVCGSPIRPGELITDVGDKAGTDRAARWAHVGCGQASLDLGAGAGPRTGPARSTREGASPPAQSTRPGVLRVWTDGACSGNPGPGGWAWATEDGRQGVGAESPSTNQRMEIKAALEAVRALPSDLVVVSDSTYVVHCFRDRWWQGWLARGWRTSKKTPVANRDLWEPLVTLVNERGDVTFDWVKGHSGDPMNDLVDELAVEASLAVRRP